MTDFMTATQLQFAMNGKNFITDLCSSGYGVLFVLILLVLAIIIFTDIL